MKENWKDLIGKRILLRKKYLTGTHAIEVTVIKVSKSGRYVRFKHESSAQSWEVPEDDNFQYDKRLEILDDDKELPVTLKNGETLLIIIKVPFENSSINTHLDDFYVTLDGDIIFDPFCIIPFDDRKILKF